MVEGVALSCFDAHPADLNAPCTEKPTQKFDASLDRRRDRPNRRYLSALKTLAQVRN